MALLFGKIFVLYFLKLSCGNGFWSKLRETDNEVRKKAIIYQKCYMKYEKSKLDLEFLYRCKNNGLFPKFTRSKHVKMKSYRIRKRYYSRYLNDAIKEKKDRKRELELELIGKLDILKNSTTWMKMHIIKYSIHQSSSMKLQKAREIHDKKFDRLLFDKRIREGICSNPNTLITNLTSFDLTDEEVEILKYGLKHGIAIRPKEPEMFAIAEDIWNQISTKNAYKDNFSSPQRIMTLLRGFTFNYLSIDDKQYSIDKKRLDTLKKLKLKCVILKPDKSHGIVLLSKESYSSSLNRVFDDESKFKKVTYDPTLSRLAVLQNYIRTLYNRKEITENVKKEIYPKAAHVGRAHGLPKLHKEFDGIPKFRPIIDTVGTPHYGVGKYLSSLLNPLAVNQHVVTDTFHAINRIKDIPTELLDSGYKYVSFDVESLFTNVPLKKTVDIILRKIYYENLISTTLKKRTLKKLLIDSCTKSVFSFDNHLFEQTDGVCMGSCLGPVLANIIMAELEKEIVDPLLADGTFKFYMRYVDDTLVLMKPTDIPMVLEKLNSFHPNINFTVDSFEDEVVHFLDIRLTDNKTDVYYKETHSGQYVHFDSFTPWRIKISWIRALYTRAERICSDRNMFNNQLLNIKKFLSWNGFPKHISNSILNRIKTKRKRVTEEEDSESIEIYFRVPYSGIKGEQLVKSLIQKMRKYLKKTVKFEVLFDSKKISFYCSNKDMIPKQQRNDVVYELTCPGCGEKYIGKTETNVATRIAQHCKRVDQPMNQHYSNCEPFKDMYRLLNVGSNDVADSRHTEFMLSNTIGNYRILYSHHNWSQLLFLEAYAIKRFKPSLNVGLKASRELVLFR